MNYQTLLHLFKCSIPKDADVLLQLHPLQIWLADIDSMQAVEQNISSTGLLTLAQEIAQIISFPRLTIDSEYLREKRELEEFKKEQEMSALINKQFTDAIKNNSLPMYQKHNDKLDAINEYALQQYIHPTKK